MPQKACKSWRSRSGCALLESGQITIASVRSGWSYQGMAHTCSLGGHFSEPIFGGRGCDEALFSEKKKGFSVKRGEAIQWKGGLVRISTGKASQWRGSGHSLNRRTLQTKKLLSSSPSRKSALNFALDERKKANHRQKRPPCPFPRVCKLWFPNRGSRFRNKQRLNWGSTELKRRLKWGKAEVNRGPKWGWKLLETTINRALASPPLLVLGKAPSLGQVPQSPRLPLKRQNHR